MLIAPTPEFWPTIGTLAVVIGGFIATILRNRESDKQREADKEERLDHQIELRLEIEKIRVTTAVTTARLSKEIQANTDLTIEGIAKTEKFADVANHVNDKFDVIAKAAGVATPLSTDTNRTVHRIEDKADTSSHVG